MIEISRTQDEEVGDGTTSVIILGKRTEMLLRKFGLKCEDFLLEITSVSYFKKEIVTNPLITNI